MNVLFYYIDCYIGCFDIYLRRWILDIWGQINLREKRFIISFQKVRKFKIERFE